jgi:mannosyltransferase OCH1-like enzyme
VLSTIFLGFKNHPLHVADTKTPWKTWFVDTNVYFDISRVPTIFHFTWLSIEWNSSQPEIPPHILQRIGDWKRLHPHWYVVIWTNAMTKRHFPQLYQTLAFLNVRVASWASNLVRYHIIAQYGGVYLDTDIIPLRILPSQLLNTPFAVCERPRDGGICKLACNAVIAAPRGNTELKEMAYEALRRTREHIQNNLHAAYDVTLTGPRFFSQTTTSVNTSFKILPAQTFFPCDWKDRSLCVANFYAHNKDVYAMHVWEKSWKKEYHQSKQV